jgi:BMFP domain-containing protein YqiC
MNENFDFNKFVNDLVVVAIQQNAEVRDALTIAAEDTVRDLFDEQIEELQLVERTEFDEIADRVITAEQDLDTISESLQDIEMRFDALETDAILEEDFERLERNFIALERNFQMYKPLLDTLTKIEPLLRKLGLIKPIHMKTYHQHPKTFHGNHDQNESLINFLS